MQQDKPMTKREKAVAHRRQKIFEAAVMCFIENGYHQTGVREIAARAGVSLGNLYNYFPGKHDILAEIAAYERAELEPFLEALAKDGPASEVLEKFVAAYTQYLSAPESVVLTLEITCEAMRQHDIADFFTDSRNEIVGGLSKLIDRGIAQDVFQTRMDAAETAQFILMIIEGSAFRRVTENADMKTLIHNQLIFVRAALT